MSSSSVIGVIGSGFSGLSAAAYLAKQGHDVHVFEKNKQLGGRARQFSKKGFKFDMGPSWYWMPDVIEDFFNDFGYVTDDFYDLIRLSPAFDILFKKGDTISVPNNYNDLKELFESIEPGSADLLDDFMEDAEFKYNISITDLIEKPSLSFKEYISYDLVKHAMKLNLFSSYQKLVRRYFSDSRLVSLMEFPVLFLGAKPQNTPSLYSMINYSGLKVGTFYPMGGFSSLTEAMVEICTNLGVKFNTNTEVDKIQISEGNINSVGIGKKLFPVDGIVASADYQHVESKLLDPVYRNYDDKYWSKKTFSPSSLIFYLGVNCRLDVLNHHTLFFDADFDQHADQIYTTKEWPDDPLFYLCCPSKTDSSVAPDGCENLFILMPLAPGLEDTEELREYYFNILMERAERFLKKKIRKHLIVKESYCINDFKNDYNAYQGNAYGLANTLNQTAILKPKMVNKKVKNLVYTGQLTVPGPGVPPSIISGKIAANLLNTTLKKNKK